MPSVSIPAAIIGASVISAGSSLAGGAIQANAADKAANLQQQRYYQTRADLQPYNVGGQADFAALNQMAPFSFNPSMSTLENLPGFQFTEKQGLKAVQNSATARGLGISGPALKGAASYATGLSASTWPELFSAQLQGYQTNVNKLLAGSQVGAGAAAQTAQTGQLLANQAGGALITAGGALGGGLASAGNTIASAATNPFLLNALGGPGAAGASGFDTTGAAYGFSGASLGGGG